METRVMMIAFVGVQGLLLVLDLIEHGVNRDATVKKERLRPATVGFLLVVTLVFLLVQIGCMSLFPEVKDFFGSIRDLCSGVFGRPAAETTLHGWRLLLVGVFCFYIAGLWDYLVHRFVGHSRWFFFIHEYHHLPNQVSLVMPGNVVRPFSAFPAFLTVAATGASVYGTFLLFGSPLWDLTPVLPVSAVITLILTASHSWHLRRYAFVYHVMKPFGLTSPQEHLLHHTVEMDGNYGQFTTIWDRVFGTYQDPFQEEYRGRRLGLPYDQDFLGTLTLGLVKLPASIRDRFQLSRYCNIELETAADEPLKMESIVLE